MNGNYILHHLAGMGEVLLSDGSTIRLNKKPYKDNDGIYWFSVLSDRMLYERDLDQKSLEKILKGARAIIGGALL